MPLVSVGALGISGMMHGYMPFDREGKLLVPFRTWRNNITGDASRELTQLFGYQIPQRWSIAHLYQAILNGEPHVKAVSYTHLDVYKRQGYQGLDATAFLEKDFPEDAGAIRWLQETVEGQPVVLEAQGDSYSDCERVSAMTGLPTVAGWYVHQWLWRNDLAALNGRVEDVENIYTGTDPVFDLPGL